MKIAWLLPGFSRDADDWAIPALQALATAVGSQHELHIFSLRYPEKRRFEVAGVTVHATGGGTRFGLRSPGIWRRTWRALRAEHKRGPFTILHAFWADEPGLIAIYAAARLGLRAIVSLAGGELIYRPEIGYGTYRSPWRRYLIRLALRRADAVTAGSRYLANIAGLHGVPLDRLLIIPLGVDIDRFQPGPAAPERPFTLIQAASLSPVKGQELLLETLAAVRQRIPDARLRIVGDGPEWGRLAALARTLHIADAVDWQGNVPYPEMPEQFQAAHCYVQSSLHESQGMSVLEGLACGLPVVGTPVGILPEVAALPGSSDPGVLAAQLATLWQDRTLYAARSGDARKLAERRFSLNRSRQRFETLYAAGKR